MTLTPWHLKADHEAEVDDGASECLDEFQKAAITALNSRNDRKRSASGEVKKKPAAARGRPPSSRGRPPASGAKKLEPVSLSRKEALQALPKLDKKSKTNPPPVHYGGGVIYTDAKGQKFRCLKTAGDRYSEKCCSFKAKDKAACWKECIQAIDDKNLKKEKKKRKSK